MEKAIKIAFLVDVMDDRLFLGGAELYVFDIINNLDSKKYELFCISDNEKYLDYIKRESIVDVNICKVRKRKKIYGDPFYLFEVASVLRKVNPSILHTNKLKSCVWGRVAGRIAGIPIIVSTVHGAPSFWSYGRIRNFINKFINAITANYFTDMNIAISKKEKDFLVYKDWVSADRVKVIYNGLFNLDLFPRKYTLDKSLINIICVGRLTREKGHLNLLKAIETLLKENYTFQLTVVGEGPERNTLIERAKTLGIYENIYFAGEVSRDTVPDFLKKADIFVSPSLWEALPYAVMEAMAVGLPVIATNVGGVEELIDDGKGGYIVEVSDNKAVTDAIYALAKNSELRKLMGEHNKEKIYKYFNGENMILHLEELYEKLLQLRM